MISLKDYILENMEFSKISLLPNMKFGKISLLENKESAEKNLQKLIKGLTDNYFEDLQYLCELAICAFRIPDDINGIVANYEPQRRRKDFVEYCEKNYMNDPIGNMYDKMIRIIGEGNWEEITNDLTPGAKSRQQKYCDILIKILKEIYKKDKNILKKAWPTNPSKLLK